MRHKIAAMFLALILILPLVSQAQTAQGTSTTSGPRRHLATIIFAGLGGAVLGLSTLSFYGRPQDHLANIAVGFGVGVIIGTGYMTYQAASNPKRFYSAIEHVPLEALEAKRLEMMASNKIEPTLPRLTWKFSF